MISHPLASSSRALYVEIEQRTDAQCSRNRETVSSSNLSSRLACCEARAAAQAFMLMAGSSKVAVHLPNRNSRVAQNHERAG